MSSINIQASVVGTESKSTVEMKTPDNALSIDSSIKEIKGDKCVWNDLLSDMWNQLYKNHELEVKNFWQRAVFLAAFLIVMYSGYGYYFSQLFMEKKYYYLRIIYHIPGIFLSGMLVLFSLLWIAMAKGSKYWYEIYEKKIAIFEDEIMAVYKQYHHITECKFGNGNCNEKGEPISNLIQSNGFWDYNASPRSPSKINIMIGWINLVIAWLLIIFHFVAMILLKFKLLYVIKTSSAELVLIFFVIVYQIVLCYVCCKIWQRVEHRIPDNPNKENTSGFRN